MANAVKMVKVDQDLFAVFDNRGSIRFVSLNEPEMLKFRTSMDSQNEAEEVLPLLQHSERQALMRETDFAILKFEIEALQEYAANNPHLVEEIFAEEQILDVCCLPVREGTLMHVIS